MTPAIALPFALQFVLHASNVADLDGIDADTRRALVDAYETEGWEGVHRATKDGALRGIPCLHVVDPVTSSRPSAPVTLGYRVRFHASTGTVEYLLPKLRPETKADRCLGSEALLQVEFYDTGADTAELERLCREGVNVCDRSYYFLGVKDAGKRGKRGGSETIYLVAVGHGESVDAALAALAQFESCKSVPKMCARIELAFSGTVPVFADRRFRGIRLVGCGGTWAQLQGPLQRARAQAGAADGDILVVTVDDIVGEHPNGQCACNAAGDPHLMSDGNGLISVELAREVRDQLGRDEGSRDHVPLAIQMRLWWGASVAKGVLTTSSALPANVVILRSSQVKVGGTCEGVFAGSLEVNTYQRQPGEARTSPFLVPLLQAVGGTPLVKQLLLMQAEAAASIRQLLEAVTSGTKPEQVAVDLFREFEPREHDLQLPGAVDPRRMIMAGFDTRDEHLHELAVACLHAKLRAIQQGRFAIPDSVSLMVIVDHTRTLPEGDVVVWMGGHPQLAPDRCLLYKSPGLHPGDVRSMRLASPTAEMQQHLQFPSAGQYALIVSSRGARSILDMIAGSDADGDCFSVIFNHDLVRMLQPSDIQPPWQDRELPSQRSRSQGPPLPAPSSLSTADRHQKRIEHLLRCRRGHALMTDVATAWKGIADERGALDRQSVELALLYMDTLDSGKADELPQLPPWAAKRARSLPIHLRKKAPTDCTSKGVRSLRQADSALAQMYCAIDASLHTTARHTECPIPYIDPHLVPLPGELTQERRERLNTWFKAYESHSKMLQQSYSPELWMKLMAKQRSLLVDGGNVFDPDEELMGRACDLYEAIYRSRAQNTCGRCAKCVRLENRNDRKSGHKFVWEIAGDLLNFVKERARRRERQKGVPVETRRAPEAVDSERFDLLMKPRKGRRAVHPRDCVRNGDEDEEVEEEEEELLRCALKADS